MGRYALDAVTRVWRRLRWRWRRARKLSWLMLAVVAAALAGIGFVFYTLVASQSERRELTCLALNVYFEARGESRAGRYAVAEVTMNRVASRRYPDTVCGVVYEKRWDRLRGREVAAFSWTEFATRPSPKSSEFREAWEIAQDVYYHRHTPTVDGALFYHSVAIKPSWARGRAPVARIGRHLFYR
jgi:spore germination cell wall hydrolase CwlJ-like protein